MVQFTSLEKMKTILQSVRSEKIALKWINVELSEMDTEFALGLGMSNSWALYKEIYSEWGDKSRLGKLILNKQFVCNRSLFFFFFRHMWSLVNQRF